LLLIKIAMMHDQATRVPEIVRNLLKCYR